MSGDLAAVLREESPAGAGELMAIALDSIESHFGKQLRARARRRRSRRRHRPGNVARR